MPTYSRRDLLEFMKRHEGFRDVIYLDSLGVATVGIGHALGSKPVPEEYRALFPVATATGVTPARIPGVIDRAFPREPLEVLFAGFDVSDAEREVQTLAELRGVDFDSLPSGKQIALVSMCYQLGAEGLGRFVKMWAALSRGDWPEAERQALDSLWARQTPGRAQETAAMLGA